MWKKLLLLAVLGVISYFGYRGWVEWPIRSQARKLNQTKKEIYAKYRTMSDNRLAQYELLKLDPTKSTFVVTRDNWIAAWEESLKKLLDQDLAIGQKLIIDQIKESGQKYAGVYQYEPMTFASEEEEKEAEAIIELGLQKMGLRGRMFPEVKREAWRMQLAPLTSDSGIKLLTKQTNLISEYEFMLDKISDEQEELNVRLGKKI